MGSIEESLKTEVIVRCKEEIRDLMGDWYRFLPSFHGVRRMEVLFDYEIEWEDYTKKYKELGYKFVVYMYSDGNEDTIIRFPIGLSTGYVDSMDEIEEEEIKKNERVRKMLPWKEARKAASACILDMKSSKEKDK